MTIDLSKDPVIKSWRCWYNNLTPEILRYDSQNHTIEDLPDDGFQAMRIWFKNGNGKYVSGNDYYFFYQFGDEVIFGQTNDLPDKIIERYPNAVIKKGKYTTESILDKINKEMINSKDPSLISTPIPTPNIQ